MIASKENPAPQSGGSRVRNPEKISDAETILPRDAAQLNFQTYFVRRFLNLPARRARLVASLAFGGV
jgi:hypothetical protein